MSRLHSQLVTLIAALSTAVCAAGQVQAEPIELDTPAGIARGWLATVDLADPAVDVRTLVRQTDSDGVAELVSPEAWLTGDGYDLVVNANFFGATGDGAARIVGLSVSDGVVVSRPRTFDGRYHPALVIGDNGRAKIGLFGTDAVSGAREAVAGVGGSATSALPGTLLVDDGLNLGETARVQPTTRRPRTAIGVSEDGEALFIIVVDGRQDGWSVGVTLPELADLLIDRGAWDAVNLDGGGSSAFIWRQGDQVLSNRPSDGGYRSVAVSLGVRVGVRAVENASASQADKE